MFKKYLDKLFVKKRKLHVGCGTLYKEGWINLDNNSDNNISKLDISHDLSLGIPFDDGVLDFIYHEHFIEHLNYEDGLKFMIECFRTLKFGGVMRVACPDLDVLIEHYRNDTWRQQDWVSKYGCEWIKSRCHMLNVCMSNWGHKFIYSEEELKSRLIEAGFKVGNIITQGFGNSSFQELKSLDTRLDSMFFDVIKK